MKRNEVFNQVAKIYEETRPSYPENLINDIIEKTKITPNEKVLEIGAGTGKATIQLAEKGLEIQCVELGENLAEILKDKCYNYPKVKVDVAAFEHWQPKENQKYDLIYCAQAFHWIDPEIRYKKCHDLLKENGHLVLFWYGSDGESTLFDKEKSSIITKYVPNFYDSEGEIDSCVENTQKRKADIISSGLFKDVEVFKYSMDSTMTAEANLKILNSYSKFAVLDEKIKSKINEEIKKTIMNHGGIVKSKLEYTMFIAKKN